MTKRHMAGGIAIILLILAGLGYHFIVGYVTATQFDDRITVLTRKNILNQIGANVVVYAGSKNTIVIDTQLSPLATSTRSKVDEFATAPITTVLVTHWHPDHSGGISAFSNDADVIAHENVVRRLSAPQEGFGLTKPGSRHEFPVRTADGLPSQTVTDGLELPTESTTINVVHYPKAHTDGDLAAFFHDSQIVVIGDLIWPNSFPYIDVHNGGSVAGLESALQAILEESKTGYRFIPGHGTTLTLNDVSAYMEVVSQTRRWVEAQLEKGQTVDQIVASAVPEKWKVWSSPLVPWTVWVEMIHASRNFAARAGQ